MLKFPVETLDVESSRPMHHFCLPCEFNPWMSDRIINSIKILQYWTDVKTGSNSYFILTRLRTADSAVCEVVNSDTWFATNIGELF